MAKRVNEKTSNVLAHACRSFPFQVLTLGFTSLIDILHGRKRSTFQTQPNMHGTLFFNTAHDTSYACIG